MATNGIRLITPSSVAVTGAGSSATINAGGSVTFSTAATLSLNGVFSSTYDNYMIAMRGVETTNNNVSIRMRATGTDATGTDYVYQQLFASSTTVSGQRQTAQSGAWTSYLATAQRSGNTIYVYGPNLAQPTAGRLVNAAGLSNAAIVDYAWTHSLSTAYDGFTLFGMTSATGLIKVYGLVQ